MTEYIAGPPGAATSAPIPTSHGHEAGQLRPVWRAERDNDGRISLFEDGVFATYSTHRNDLDDCASRIEFYRKAIERAEAVRNLLLREREAESELLDELVDAGWVSEPDPGRDVARNIVRRILAAQKKRAES